MHPSLRRLQCLVKITNGVFKTTSSAPESVFQSPIKAFSVHQPGDGPQNPAFWAITGSGKSPFLSILSGKYIPEPPLARVYPFMAENYRYDQIVFLNFKEASGLDAVHLSARYESYSYKGQLEMADDVNSVRNYISGANNYNSNTLAAVQDGYVELLLELFDLVPLQKKWINSLSNGQLRRARLARALVSKPRLLLIDDPFLGLDPGATELVSASLHKVSAEFGVSIVLGLRVQDQVPDWIDNVALVDLQEGVQIQGPRTEVQNDLKSALNDTLELHSRHMRATQMDKLQPVSPEELSGEVPHIEFNKASVVYKGVSVLKDFTWRVPRGSRWRIFGANGTGKTTIILLLTADHPQSWRLVMSIDGVVRKTGSGVSFFDVNNQIGISSPELHALVPGRTLTMREIVYNGLVKDVGNSNFNFKGKEDALGPKGRAILVRFEDRLDKYGDTTFDKLSLTDQKLALFLRAVVKEPSILILDEAFSCMDDESVMEECHKLVEEDLKKTTVFAIGHIDWEVPHCDYVLRLHGGEERAYDILRVV